MADAQDIQAHAGIDSDMIVQAEMSKFNFEGRTIRLLPSLFVAITMNPSYAGRSPLPDNLVDLFRPIAMTVIDYEPVAEVLLFAGGELLTPLILVLCIQHDPSLRRTCPGTSQPQGSSV